MAELEPMSVVYGTGDDMKRRMTDRVPKPGAIVEEASDDAEIKTGLKIPEDGVFLGHLSVGGEKVRTAAEPPTVDYRVKDDYADGDPLAFRHPRRRRDRVGEDPRLQERPRRYLDADRTYPTGDGRESRMAVVQFDPQDEYAQMHDDNPDLDADFARRLDRGGSRTAATTTPSHWCHGPRTRRIPAKATAPSAWSSRSPSRWRRTCRGSSPAPGSTRTSTPPC